jgi:thioredoxin-like negative regulator of GroEL
VGDSTSNFEALATAGLGLAQCEDYNRAIPVLEKARSLRPDSMSIRYNLALARYKDRKFQAALETLRSIPSTDGADNAELLYLRGKVRQALSQEGGIEDLAQACRLRPAGENFCVDASLKSGLRPVLFPPGENENEERQSGRGSPRFSKSSGTRREVSLAPL